MNGIEFKRCKECDVEGMFNSDDILCFDCGSELILLSLVPAQDLARITEENIALRKLLARADVAFRCDLTQPEANDYHWRTREDIAAALKQSS